MSSRGRIKLFSSHRGEYNEAKNRCTRVGFLLSKLGRAYDERIQNIEPNLNDHEVIADILSER